MRKGWFSIFIVLFVAVCITPLPAWAGLENPAPGSVKSGVSVVSGWVCDAEELEVSFDGGPRQFVPYGSERSDTSGVCGDTDNGFGLLINYNELGDGEHTITLYNDGQVVTTRTFTVVTQGEAFPRDLTVEDTGHYVLVELSNGIKAEVVWDEGTQSFAIADYFTLGDLLGKWGFSWYVENSGEQTRQYELTHIETVDGYPIIKGKGPDGTNVQGGYVVRHIEHATPMPPPNLTIPYFTPINYEQFFIIEHTQTTDGQWICAFFFWDVGIADDLPPGTPAEVLFGDLNFTTATPSQCQETVIPDNTYLVSADRIE